MRYWLLKSEPGVYPLSRLQAEGKTFWDGVRNFQARNNLKEMKNGDLCLFYHSNEGKEIAGMARVVREWYPDPTHPDDTWAAVDVAYEETFPRPVGLAEIKAHPVLKNMALVKNSRLSVLPVTPGEFDLIIRLTHP